MRRPWALLLLALALAAPSAAAAATPLAPCPGERGARCGTLEVPLDRAQSAGPTTRVTFELLRRRSAGRPALGTIVAVAGSAGEGTSAHREELLALLRPLLGRRDLVLVDRRGTGRSAAQRCSVGAPRACSGRLGASAAVLGSGAAAEDVLAVLDDLGIPQADLYAAGYGTVVGQAFAARHPDRLRSLVLDGPVLADGLDVWRRASAGAVRRVLRAVCEAGSGCAAVRGDAAGRLGALATRLARRELGGLDEAALVDLVAAGDHDLRVRRELDAAGRALRAGDAAPLRRLAAEVAAAAPRRLDGAGLAAPCVDLPRPWSATAADELSRRTELTAARRALGRDATTPFGAAAWAASATVGHTGCLAWPYPATPDPPVPAGAAPWPTPTLLLAGELGVGAPLEDAQTLAARLPAATLAAVPHTGAVPALSQGQGCAAELVRRFVGGLRAGTTACLRRIATVRAVPVFPRRAADAPPARKGRATDRSTLQDRRVGTTATLAVADVLARWAGPGTHTIRGLRGGTAQARGDERVTLLFQGLRFANDLQLFGAAAWNRTTGRVDADLVLLGPATEPAALHVAWNVLKGGRADLFGTVGRRPIRLQMEAP